MQEDWGKVVKDRHNIKKKNLKKLKEHYPKQKLQQQQEQELVHYLDQP